MASLFARVLGDAFATLPPRVRALHTRGDSHTYNGRADVERGAGALARIICAAATLPRAGSDIVLELTIDASAGGERWSRNFDGRSMVSRLWQSGPWLRERLGAASLSFILSAEDEVLCWRVAAVRVFGVPMPARWFSGVSARESERAGRYRFDVRAELPMIGLLVHYRGWLDVG